MIIIGEVVLVLFAIAGLVAVCYKIADVLLRPDYHVEVMMVLPFHGRVEDIEYQLRHFAAQYRKVVKREDAGWLICLDNGMDPETRIICENVCGEFSFMNLCTKEQLEKLIS